MLVLSRKENESIMIGGNIEVVIIESKDGSTKLGINAPQNIKVYRKEIFEEIKNENNKAVESDINIIKKMLDGR